MEKNKILLIKTVQITPFKILITALKDILLETNIIFTEKSLKIINMDKSHTILVHLNLFSENFEHFECNKDKIIIGVNMQYLFKLINNIDNEETLSIYIDEDEYNDGIVEYLTLQFENKNKEQCKIQKLKLIEPDNEELNIPDVNFSSVINISSNDFQKIIRDLHSISDKVEIKSLNDELIFKSNGAFASSEIIRRESDSMDMKSKPDKIIQGFFSLKNLNYFVKCTNLCNQIEIYIDNDLPIIIKYNVASLGELRLGLSPLEKPL